MKLFVLVAGCLLVCALADTNINTNEDQAVFAVLSEPADNAVFYFPFEGPSHGSVVGGAPDPQLQYTPTPDFCGSDSFVYSYVTGGTTTNYTAHITVACVNDPVSATDQSADVRFADPPQSTPIDLNVADIDGDTLTVTIDTAPTQGTLSAGASSTQLVYTPSATGVSPDSFTYTVSDGSTTATATVTLNFANVIFVDVNGQEDGGLIFAELPPNDGSGVYTYGELSSPNGQYLGFSTPDNIGGFTPNANWCGVETFDYNHINDQQVSQPYTTRINVACVNDPPTVSDQSASTMETVPVTITSNAADVDGDTLTYTVPTPPSAGTITQNPSGTFTYTPNADSAGLHEITYEVSDGSATVSATLSITVTAAPDPPVAMPDAYITELPNPLAVDADTGVLANDMDPAGGSLSCSLNTPPDIGTVEVHANGSFVYTPDIAEGPCTVDFTVDVTSSASGLTVTSSVTLEVKEPCTVAGDDWETGDRYQDGNDYNDNHWDADELEDSCKESQYADKCTTSVCVNGYCNHTKYWREVTNNQGDTVDSCPLCGNGDVGDKIWVCKLRRRHGQVLPITQGHSRCVKRRKAERLCDRRQRLTLIGRCNHQPVNCSEWDNVLPSTAAAGMSSSSINMSIAAAAFAVLAVFGVAYRRHSRKDHVESTNLALSGSVLSVTSATEFTAASTTAALPTSATSADLEAVNLTAIVAAYEEEEEL